MKEIYIYIFWRSREYLQCRRWRRRGRKEGSAAYQAEVNNVEYAPLTQRASKAMHMEHINPNESNQKRQTRTQPHRDTNEQSPNRQRSSKIAKASRAAGPECLCRHVRKSIDSGSLASTMWRSLSMTLSMTNLTNWQCRRRCGRHHSNPRFMQLESQKEGLFHSIYPLVHTSKKRRCSTEGKHIRLQVVCHEWWGSW